MNKHFDKVLFLLGVLACTAGAGATYWLHKNLAKLATAPVGEQKKEGGYQRVEIAEDTQDDPEDWTEPRYAEPQSNDFLWKHELFTPVKIVWSKTNNYMPDGTVLPPKPPFGVKLLSIAHPVYRLSFKGFIGVHATILDATTGKHEDVKKGDDNKTLGVRVTDFWTDKKGGDGSTSGIRIYDHALKREFVLLDGVPYVFTEKSEIRMARTDNTAETWLWENVGDTRRIEGIGEFVLEAADCDAKTVRVKKTYEAKNIYDRINTETQLETLTPTAPAAQPRIVAKPEDVAIPKPVKKNTTPASRAGTTARTQSQPAAKTLSSTQLKDKGQKQTTNKTTETTKKTTKTR